MEPAPEPADPLAAGLRSILGRIPRMRTYSVEKAREEGGTLDKARKAMAAYADVEGDESSDRIPKPLGDIDLQKKAEQLGIRYFLVSYAPLNTDSRVSTIPRRAIRDVQQAGCGVPAAMFYHADGADPEMYVLPDPQSLIQLPWRPEYGWLAR